MRSFGGLADARVELVAWVKLAIEVGQCGLDLVEVADVVFSRIFGASLIEQLEQSSFDHFGVDSFAEHVVLMEHVAEEVSVIEREVDL